MATLKTLPIPVNAKVLILGLLFGIVTTATAQHSSERGLFAVNEIRACAPFTLVITSTAGTCSGASTCQMNFEGTRLANTFSHLYTVPGTYSVKVLIPGNNEDSIRLVIDPNVQPLFEIYTCSARKVEVNVTDRTYDTYSVDFGDGSPAVDASDDAGYTTSPHGYPSVSPPPYTISVRGQHEGAANNCNAATESFDAINTIPIPRITSITALDATSVQIDFTAAEHVQLRVEMAANTSNAGSIQLLQTLYGVSTYVASGLDLDHKYYCFRLNAFDVCADAPRYSNIVCTQILNAVPQSNHNDLDWTTSSTGVTKFEIVRDASVIKTVASAAAAYSDPDVVCKTTYCYQVRAVYGGGTTSTSLSKCVVAFDNTTPLPILDGSAVVGEDQVTLTWLENPALTDPLYSILRSTLEGAFQSIGTTATNTYTDASYSTQASTCYRIDFKDQCDNPSPEGAEMCPIRLTGRLDLSNIVTVSWSEYTGWSAGVNRYTLAKYDINGTVLFNKPMGNETSYIDDAVDKVNQVVSYKVTAIPNNSTLISSESNTLKFTKRINLYHPTAFSPNADKLNDSFSVQGFFIKSMRLFIFDRWGAIIYASDTAEPWNGTVHGNVVPESTYVWKVDGVDVAGNAFSDSGSIVLIATKSGR